eukprot:g14436.t1
MEEALTAKLHTDVPGEGATLYKHLCDLVGTCAEKNDPNTLALLEYILFSIFCDLSSSRFWGKILGTEKDYLVYEAAIAGQGVGADAYEARGVQNEALGALTQLPEVTTAQITKSRVLQKYFSGDLNKDIISCPWFGGKEIHLLRAQIARITHSCTLHVNGFHAVDEESGKLVEAEDFAMPAVEELGTQGTWVHSRDYILKNGKTSYPDGEAQEAMDEDTKAALDAEMEECPPIPVLTPIQGDLDQDDDGNSLAWTVKQVGDKSRCSYFVIYTFNDVTKQYTVTVVESKRWPGAFTVCQSSNVHNIYIGYGVKKETAMPILVPYLGAAQLGLPPIMTEPDDQEENPEPNPEEPDAASDGGDEDPPQ